MNKTQKIIIAIGLFIMAFILFYPPVGVVGPNFQLPEGRKIIFSLQARINIDLKRLLAELLFIFCLGASITILCGLKHKDLR